MIVLAFRSADLVDLTLFVNDSEGFGLYWDMFKGLTLAGLPIEYL